MADRATKTSIDEIDDLPIKINGIIVPIKVLIMEATQYQALRQGKWNNQPCLACGKTLLDKGIWNNIPGCGGICNISCQYTILISDWVRKETPIEAAWRRTVQRLDSCPYDDDKIWRMAIAKIERATPEEIKEIKNNPSEPIELDWDPEPIINLLDPEQFHEHYQELAPTRKKQEQCLEEINTKLCDYCLIPCDFQYCDECNFIYNPPSCMIYTIPEKKEPINSCASELELVYNPNSNPNNNDDENTSSSSVQCNNKNINNSDSDPNYKQYIALPNLSKEQELKWYSNNGEGIMSE
ncbi:hypothetical protein G9A89_018255 [Geosiphon pyriformis]|nr:hypothetical protein G9A89_018255 [Geosiphon pyriformis]